MADQVPPNSTMFFNAHPESEGWKQEHQRQIQLAREQAETKKRRETLTVTHDRWLTLDTVVLDTMERLDNS